MSEVYKGKKFGVNYLFQPFFVQQLGVFSKTPMTEGKLKVFLDVIPEKYRFCELRFNESNTLVEYFCPVK